MPLLDYLRGFAPQAQSAFVRRAYMRELTGELSFTFPLAMLQAGVISVIGALLFGVGPMGVATITAAPMFANATSTLWARLAHGRRKAIAVAVLQSLFLVMVATIALLPIRPSSATLFVGLYVLTRCLVAGVITIRTVIWRANYPRHSRSRITGRLMLLNTCMLALLPLVAGKLFDAEEGFDPRLYKAVYLAAALIGTIGVVAYAGLRVRRERALLKEERAAQAKSDTAEPGSRVSALHVLRTDHHFRSYMVWQFFAGVATMAGNTVLIAFITQQLSQLPDDWTLGSPRLGLGRFLVGFILTEAAVQLFVALSLPFWAHYLDKVHVTRFRTRHGLTWIFTQSTAFIAVFAATFGIGFEWLMLLILIPRIGQGLLFGGGRLAWQLGHHDFADRHLAATYMAIHQTLTGVRGFIAPFLGVLLYTGFNKFHLFGLSIPAWQGIGYWVFAITLASALIGWYGFVRLDKKVGGDGAAQAHD
ncbi:MAG: MFS transporter [Phycisphaeraceae bacterium]|nr:MFS transporter [Phycisphaeraceae bacterium]